MPHILVKELLSSYTNKNNLLQNDYIDIDFDTNNYNENEITKTLLELKLKNTSVLGLIRSEIRLKNHLTWLNNLCNQYYVDTLAYTSRLQEVKNMILLSKLICLVTMERKNSLGVHYREDFPESSDDLNHSILTKNSQLSWKVAKRQKELISFLE